jgi:DnaJ-class molecular chaperone
MSESTSNYSYYDILEVSPHCPQHEITGAYEKAKHTYATDNPAIYTMFNEEEARELLKMVEEAYSVLGNKTLRAIYDEKIGQKRPHSDLTFSALQAESKAVFNEMPKKITPLAKLEFKPDDIIESEIKSKSDWYGEDLKKIREYKRFSLEKMSEVTKISSYYINAIENMDSTGLPAAVFVRGYVSQISKVLALDDKRVCDSYMRNFKSSIEKK